MRERHAERPMERRMAALEQKLADARSELRKEISASCDMALEIVGEAVGELLAELRDKLRDEMKSAVADEARAQHMEQLNLHTAILELRQLHGHRQQHQGQQERARDHPAAAVVTARQLSRHD